MTPVLSRDRLLEIFLGGDAGSTHSYFANALSLILNDDSTDRPRFNVLMSILFHGPYVFDENGNYAEVFSEMDAKYYRGQHRYASKVLINMVDMILEKDPDAVIILQADHGMNCHSEEEMALSFGEGQYDMAELSNSIMSAIRIPEIYRNGDESYAVNDPLNISRYLINSYVGKNYEYREELS